MYNFILLYINKILAFYEFHAYNYIKLYNIIQNNITERISVMAKQLNLSFKENPTELELYDWVKSKLNPGVYIKELLYTDYLAEKNGLQKNTYTEPIAKNTDNAVNKNEVIINTGFDINDADEF